MLFDTHAHYDDTRFDEDRHQIIAAAYESGVGYILNASSNISSIVDSISLAQRYPYIFAAAGIHPHHAGEVNGNTLPALADFASDSKVVAIGEIGLDYFYDFSPREVQKHWFARQISLARDLHLPVIVHNREAHEDSLRIIKSEKAKEVGGVFHCFSGSVEMARELLDHNFYISVGGAVTFKNARKLIEVVASVPLDRLLIETDCPYMTPEPFRGQRNDSSRVRLVAEKIAQIKGISFEEVAEATTKNAFDLFKIQP